MHIKDLFPLDGKILVCGPNWLGDSIMSMPAIQVLKRQFPGVRLTMLVKPGVAPLWRMHAGVDTVLELNKGLPGTIAAILDIRERGFDAAYVFPNSFRSAFIPFMGGIPVRTGAAGHSRGFMLTDVVQMTPENLWEQHQMWEYFRIFGIPPAAGKNETPVIKVPQAVIDEVRGSFGLGGRSGFLGLVPGAARGASKRWPVEHFAEVGRTLSSSLKCGVLLFGTPGEKELCGQICEAIGTHAVNLAGRTAIPDFVVLLGLCRLVITNDCGGMHLASASGTKVVAVFGLTDPAKTGPIGADSIVVSAEGVEQSRDIERDSKLARDVMRSIVPERVLAAASKLLGSAKG